MAAPALAASTHEAAISAGVTGTAGFLRGLSAEPVTAHEIMTLRCIVSLWLPVHKASIDSAIVSRTRCSASVRREKSILCLFLAARASDSPLLGTTQSS